MRRVLLATMMSLGVGLPVGGAILSAAPGSAFAEGGAVKCAALAGEQAAQSAFERCTPAKTKFVTASVSTADLTSGVATLTWSPSGKTTTISVHYVSGNSCPAGDSEEVAKGKVTASKAKYTKVGDKVKFDFCIDPIGGDVTLAPGTVAAL
jgi:hypothetical protein